MGASTLLERLECVRSGGDSKWVARCPAHADGRPSLSVKELPNGRVLVHCFAGCPPAAVLNAVGLSFTDLTGSETTGYMRALRALYGGAQ